MLKIPAFLDGSSLAHYSSALARLAVANAGGIVKLFDSSDPTSEPVSVDIPENATQLASHGRRLLLTSTDGLVSELVFGPEITGDESYSALYTTENPMRDAVYINDGRRIVCGGDAAALVVIDTAGEKRVGKVPLPARMLNVAYNPVGELVAVSLDNRQVHVYSVVNEELDLVVALDAELPEKVHTSTDTVDYTGLHAHELVCTRPVWTLDGETLLVPQAAGLASFLRSDWARSATFEAQPSSLVSLGLSQDKAHVALLHVQGTVHIYNVSSRALVHKVGALDIDSVPVDIEWTEDALFVTDADGEVHRIEVPLFEDPEVEQLFLDAASESETEDLDSLDHRKRNALDDSNILDEDDFEPEYVRKKARFQEPEPPKPEQIVPYLPGSTPWIKSMNSAQRRYLFMNDVGYTWSVKSEDSLDERKSITISFFDRSINKDYHFIDNHSYDLCSLNERGLLLASSGFQEPKSSKGRLFYRHHASTNDSWERQIPLAENEYLTAICITASASETGDAVVAVGTNLGYLRIFNLYGLCIGIMKTTPIVSLISSAAETVFSIHQPAKDCYTYLIISVSEDCKFLQQDCTLPLKKGLGPLIKGLFFNEFSDPCLVAGNDDTLTVLSHWREPNNARWVPVLNCRDKVTDYGLSETKKSWSTWPLGLQEDRMVCLVLKNSDAYPGFPLPLPVELDLRFPVKCHKSIGGAFEERLGKIEEADPEEEFLRAATLGKLLASSLDGDEDEHMETLSNYSVAFDKALLKLFNGACQESRLNKAYSVVKIIKNDKALLAATKIAERHNFMNLMAKINKLREDLLEMEED